MLVDSGGTDDGRVDRPPASLSAVVGGEGAGEGGGLDLSSRDMSSLAVVKINGA